MARELLDFAKQAHDTCGITAMKLRFDQKFHKDGALMCSYATLIEHMGGMIALVEAGKRTSSTAVMRSMLEAFVDFNNLLNDRSYFQNMLAKLARPSRAALAAFAVEHGHVSPSDSQE